VGLKNVAFLSSSPPWFGESTHQKFMLFDTWTGSRRAENGTFCFLFALFVLQTHFILRPSTLICIPISLLFVVWVFLISRGLYWLFCGHFTRPRVYSDFFASYRASWVEKREENRCSVRLSRLDCRGAFCIMGFYSFFNDGLKR